MGETGNGSNVEDGNEVESSIQSPVEISLPSNAVEAQSASSVVPIGRSSQASIGLRAARALQIGRTVLMTRVTYKSAIKRMAR